MSEPVTIDLLKGLLEAFNRHDLDAIMTYFAEDCVFYMPRGAKPRGNRYVGKEAVRGVDLLEFAQGKIICKDSFWKIVE